MLKVKIIELELESPKQLKQILPQLLNAHRSKTSASTVQVTVSLDHHHSNEQGDNDEGESLW